MYNLVVNKKWIYVVFIVALLGVIGAIFLLKKNEITTGSTTNVTITQAVEDNKTNNSPELESEEKNDESSYIEYTNNSFDNSSDKRRVLFFYASWCPTCRVADPNIRQNVSQIPKDVAVLRVNYNDPETDGDEKKLAQNYNITYQHTFVQVDSQGNEVAKWNGGQIEEILSNIK